MKLCSKWNFPTVNKVEIHLKRKLFDNCWNNFPVETPNIYWFQFLHLNCCFAFKSYFNTYKILDQNKHSEGVTVDSLFPDFFQTSRRENNQLMTLNKNNYVHSNYNRKMLISYSYMSNSKTVVEKNETVTWDILLHRVLLILKLHAFYDIFKIWMQETLVGWLMSDWPKRKATSYFDNCYVKSLWWFHLLRVEDVTSFFNSLHWSLVG